MYYWYLLLLAFLGLSQPITSDRFDGRQCCDRYHQDFSDTRLSLYGSYSDKPSSDSRNLNRAPNISVSRRIDTKNTNFRSTEKGENVHLREKDARNLFEERFISRETVRKDSIKNNDAYNSQTFNRRLVVDNYLVQRFHNDRYSPASIESRIRENFVDLRDANSKRESRYLTRAREDSNKNLDKRIVIREKENDEQRFVKSRIESTLQRNANEDRRSRYLDVDNYSRANYNRARNNIRDRNLARASVREDNSDRRLKDDSEQRLTRFERADNAHQTLIRHNSRIMTKRQNYVDRSQVTELMFDQVTRADVSRRLNERYPIAAHSMDNIAKHKTERASTRVKKLNKVRGQYGTVVRSEHQLFRSFTNTQYPDIEVDRQPSHLKSELSRIKFDGDRRVSRAATERVNTFRHITQQLSPSSTRPSKFENLSRTLQERHEFAVGLSHSRSSTENYKLRVNTERQLSCSTLKRSIMERIDNRRSHSYIDNTERVPYHTQVERQEMLRFNRRLAATLKKDARRCIEPQLSNSIGRRDTRTKRDVTQVSTEIQKSNLDFEQIHSRFVARFGRQLFRLSTDRRDSRLSAELRTTRLNTERKSTESNTERNNYLPNTERQFSRTTKSIDAGSVLSQRPTENVEGLFNSNRDTNRANDKRRLTRSDARESNQQQILLASSERGDILYNTDRRYSRFGTQRQEPPRRTDRQLSTSLERIDIHRTERKPSDFATERAETRRNMAANSRSPATRQVNRRNIDLTVTTTDFVNTRRSSIDHTISQTAFDRSENRHDIERPRTRFVASRQGNQRSIEGKINLNTGHKEIRRRTELHDSRFAETRQGDRRSSEGTQSATERVDITRNIERSLIKHIENRRGTNLHNTRSSARQNDQRRKESRLSHSTVKMADITRVIERSSSEDIENRRSIGLQDSRYVTHKGNRRSVDVARSIVKQISIRHNTQRVLPHNVAERTETRRNMARLNSGHVNTQDNRCTHGSSTTRFIENIQNRRNTERYNSRYAAKSAEAIVRSTTEIADTRSCSVGHESTHIAVDRVDNHRCIQRRNSHSATQQDNQCTIGLISSNNRPDIRRSIERELNLISTERNENRRSRRRENTRFATSRQDNRRNVDFARSITESADSRRPIIKREISQTDRSENRRSMERQYSRFTTTHQNNRRSVKLTSSSNERSDIHQSIVRKFSNASERRELQPNEGRLRFISATTNQDNRRYVEATHFTSKRANTIPNIERKLYSATERSENRRRLERYVSRSTTEVNNNRHEMHKTDHRMSFSGMYVSRQNNERQEPQRNFRQNNVDRQLAPFILELNRNQKYIAMNYSNKQESKDQVDNFNWQLLFYIVQVIYICGIFLQVHTDDGNKMKTRNIGLWNPMYQIKVANSAIAYLQRALLAPALSALGGGGWEACFEHVLLPLLAEPPRRADAAARADTVMCKVFLQHLGALSSRASFAALWARVLRVQRALLAAPREPLQEAALESLKNMLLVMHSVGIFNTGDNYNDLWYITWEIVGEFLPRLKEELFPDVNDNMKPASNLPNHLQPPIPSSLPTLIPVGPNTPTILPVRSSPPNATNTQVIPNSSNQIPSTLAQTSRSIHVQTSLAQSPNILVASMAHSPVNLVQTPPLIATPSLVAPTPISIVPTVTDASQTLNTAAPTLSGAGPAIAGTVPTPVPVSGMVPIRNSLYDQTGLTSSVLLQPLNEMISTPIGISIQTPQPAVLYPQSSQPTQNSLQYRSDTNQSDPQSEKIEPLSNITNLDKNTTILEDTQQSELYAEYLTNPYNGAKEISLKEATLYDPQENRHVSDMKDQTVLDPETLDTFPILTQKSLSANATPMHSKNKAQFSSNENVRQESSIFNFASYFGSANDIVIPGSEVFDTLMSTQEG
ncbi:unnamed protein product [Parnassius apollo]|uniref:(apollo) hypothetical protein n=1 Tax=Parnassius apollo TaxID=110799 RepID=A0A8S3X1E9_PARAO|nr:unnamed protein product [Parnassius apollo]